MIAEEADARGWLRTLPWYDELANNRLERLVSLLADENARQNLVAASSLGEVWRRHIADSAQLLHHVPDTIRSWLDIGTGAGFPGVVCASMRPDVHVELVESRPLRAAWLKRLSHALDLANVRISACRLERLSDKQADVISARAFAPLDRLVALSARFSTSATAWVLPKGRSAGEELHRLQGWNHTFHVEQSLTDRDAGIIVGRLLGPKDKRR